MARIFYYSNYIKFIYQYFNEFHVYIMFWLSQLELIQKVWLITFEDLDVLVLSTPLNMV